MEKRLEAAKSNGELVRGIQTTMRRRFELRLVELAQVYVLLAAAICVYPAAAQTTTLKPETARAFDTYVRKAEAQMRERVSGKKSFLWLDEHPDQRAQVMSGNLVTENLTVDNGKAPSGMIHDWLGAVFIPGVAIDDVTRFFQNPSAQTEYYPELIRAEVLSHKGNSYRFYRRFLKKKVLTAVLDGEFESRYEYPDASRCVVTEHSTKIVEIENRDTPQETARPVGEDRGFMWRLNSYWRLQKTENGVLAELRTISLSRSIPTGLGWMIKPFITQIPVESLTSTLRGTRRAVEGR